MIKRRWYRYALRAALLLSWLVAARPAVGQHTSELPAGWQEAWENPGPRHRPLQIVHGIDLQGRLPEGVEQMVAGSRPGRVARTGMQHYRDHGLGGLVCNVAFQDYMTSEQNWKTLIAAVEACHELGLIVWIYDEQGYESLVLPAGVVLPKPAAAILERYSQAGGRVLRDGVGNATSSPESLTKALQPAAKVQPASPQIVLGRFTRDERDIILVVNVGTQAYEGRLSPPTSGNWLSLDPATGEVGRAEINDQGVLPLVLKARQTGLLVGQANAK